MNRISILLLTTFLSIQVIAEGFFPPNYKVFQFSEGDLLASQRAEGLFAVNKILKIDKVVLKAGESINIQGQSFTAPVEDFLLIISMAYGTDEFDSLEKAKHAAEKGNWTIRISHVPNRPPGAETGQVLIGNEKVKDEELVGYKKWKESFIKGEAGVF